MKKKNILSKTDQQLFREAVKDVRVLKGEHRTHSIHRVKKKPIQHDAHANESINSHLSDAHEDQFVGSEEKLSYYRSGIQTKMLKRLRNGKLPIEGKLDLHGLSVTHARQEVSLFLQHCQTAGKKCVIIVHGKSTINQHPILKSMLNRWLRQIPAVLAFSSSLAQHGGTGAVYVLIKNIIPHNQ